MGWVRVVFLTLTDFVPDVGVFFVCELKVAVAEPFVIVPLKVPSTSVITYVLLFIEYIFAYAAVIPEPDVRVSPTLHDGLPVTTNVSKS